MTNKEINLWQMTNNEVLHALEFIEVHGWILPKEADEDAGSKTD
jgi:hypothetical protein